MMFLKASTAVAALAVAFSATVTSASAQPASTKVTCKDSTIVRAGPGACSAHGGVKLSRKKKAVASPAAKSPLPPIHKTPVPSAPGKVTPTAAETSPIKKTPPPDSTAKARKKIP